jgi:hypothetical protein
LGRSLTDGRQYGHWPETGLWEIALALFAS